MAPISEPTTAAEVLIDLEYRSRQTGLPDDRLEGADFYLVVQRHRDGHCSPFDELLHGNVAAALPRRGEPLLFQKPDEFPA
ncbi:MAG TPA: hypothetical protein VN667_13960 [Burkholderiales bacterium]|nr:hypothetical protein [Burkholderiales bacterium]